jgi:hypothetical protein
MESMNLMGINNTTNATTNANTANGTNRALRGVSALVIPKQAANALKAYNHVAL